MSVVGTSESDCARSPVECDPPAAGFESAVDDHENPSSVTIYPVDADEDELVTTWVTAPLSAVVSLHAMR